MSWTRSLTLSLFALLTIPSLTSAQSFEGVLKERSVEMSEEGLFDLLWSGDEDEPEFETQAEWFRYTASKLFDIPVDRILQTPGTEASETTIWIKGTRIRYAEDGPGSGGAYMLVDVSDMTTRWVVPSTRSYMETTPNGVADATREMMEQMGIDAEALAEIEEMEYDDEFDEEYGEDDEEYGEDELRFAPAVRALNRTQEVNGLQASGFEAEVGAEVGRGWCAQDVTGIRAAMEELAEQADQFGDTDEEHEGETVEDLLCKDQLPVLVKVLRSDVFGGGFRFTINEVQSVERREVDPELFQIPEGYERKTLAEMWR